MQCQAPLADPFREQQRQSELDSRQSVRNAGKRRPGARAQLPGPVFTAGGKALRGLYRDRWPVEQVPSAGKQMLGGARQFVFAPESCQRLPELNLLAGAIVTYLAATLPAVPTGFWDRNPKPTPGRLRRLLARVNFPKSYPLPERIRKKDSVCDHLPKGILGHRRTKQTAGA